MTFHEFSFEDRPFTGLGVQNARDPSFLIFLLHGHMGDAPSNMPFARELTEGVPDSTVIVPNALSPVTGLNDPSHRQWWEISPESDPSCLAHFERDYTPLQRRLTEEALPKARFIAGALNRFIVRTAENYGKKLSDCAVVGISQGGMAAWEMTLFRKELAKSTDSLGALVIIGAGIMKAERPLASPYATHIPVFIAGGNQDECFPPPVNAFSESVLQANGMTVSRIQENSVHYGLEHIVKKPVCAFLNEIRRKNESVP